MFFNRRPFRFANDSSWKKEAESAMKWTMELQQINFPRCDLYEAENAFILEAEIPGLELTEIHVQMVNNQLVLNGTCSTMRAGTHYYLKERPHVTFNKKITIPSPINREGIRYSLKNGVLTIELLKEEEDEVVLYVQREDQ